MTADDGSDLRRRTATKQAEAPSAAGHTSPTTQQNVAQRKKDKDAGIGLFDILRVILGLALASTIGSYLVSRGDSLIWGAPRPWWTKPNMIMQSFKPQLQLTNEELAAYDGSDPSKPILLALNRTIYDVSSSPKVYGPGGMYSTLAAKDASRSYVTTCFDPVDDLVPYLGGVEEIYVPLWLSKSPSQTEMDGIATGDIMEGVGVSGMIDAIKGKVGRRKTRKLQDDAYETARERVRAQIQSWESMFAKKEYPIVGRVVGVDESDPKKWKGLKFCEAALKQRPGMAESLGAAVKAVTGSEDISLEQMKRGMNRMAGKPDPPKKKKGKKSKGKKNEKAGDDELANAEGGFDGYKDSLKKKADANIEDMMHSGDYNQESKEQVEKTEKAKKEGKLGKKVAEEKSEQKEREAEAVRQ